MKDITRKPLARFINKMGSTSIDFFTKANNLYEYGPFFIEILKYDESHIIRERLSRDVDIFIVVRLLPEMNTD